MAKILYCLVFYFVSFAYTQSDSPVIQISSGLIEGQYLHSKVVNKSYYSFRGIPYAKPPIGKLRFQPPVKPDPWDHVLETKIDGSKCMQRFWEFGGTEDCLYLNVYTPTLPSNETSNELLPVMVNIHGGGFVFGSSNSSVDGPDFLMEHNVVLVGFNYRLNIFGFLNAMEESAPGNVGLKDQLAVLQWVQENIKQFNGDPTQVTIFGQSAGGASVQYHMQSKLSKGLFQRAIVQSGSTLDQWTLEEDPVDLIQKIGNLISIDSANVTEIISNLQNIPAEELFKIYESKELLNTNHRTSQNRFVPSIEYNSPNAFITENSYSLLEGNNIEVVPFISGYVSCEGLMTAGDSALIDDLKKNPLLFVPKSLNILDNIESQRHVAVEIGKQYFNNDSAPEYLSFAAFFSDDMFVRGIRKTIELRRNTSQIFHYIFDFRSPDWMPGAIHAAEMRYIYYVNGTTETEEETILRKQMTTLWTNFAKTGNPTPNSDPILNELNWPTVSRPQEDLQYLYIGNQLEIRENPWQEYYDFWENIYSTYGKPPFSLY